MISLLFNYQALNTMQTITLDPLIPAKHTIIWLHGLGANGNDFVPIAKQLALPTTWGVRFLFPEAPLMPVTLNNGYIMRAWFDVYGFTEKSPIDAAGIQRSIQVLQALLTNEIQKGIDSNNIMLAGFSQGAVMALITGLSYDKPLGGIIALSGFLPTQQNVYQPHAMNLDTPIFLAHGKQDNIVPYHFGEQSYEKLLPTHPATTWHAYPHMAHTVCDEEINDIKQWIMQSQ